MISIRLVIVPILMLNTKDNFSEWEISIMKILDVLETFIGLIFLIGITVHDFLC